MKISKIAIYNSTISDTDVENITKFLQEKFNIITCKGFFPDVSSEILPCKITNLVKALEDQDGKEMIDSSTPMYDGVCLQAKLAKAIPQKDRLQNCLHIVFTDMLFGTYDYDGYKYHSRAIIGANPCIISTTGIVEAPARPREYYVAQATKRSYTGWRDWIEYGDSRIIDVIRGYCMQAIAYYVTGEMFCQDPKCVMHNAHWQQELYRSHLESGKLCKKHESNVYSMLKE